MLAAGFSSARVHALQEEPLLKRQDRLRHFADNIRKQGTNKVRGHFQPRTEDKLSESKSKAAVLVRYQEPLEIREYPTPREVGAGEALVRVDAAGICGTDVHLWLGQLQIPLPVILGHETVGRIEM